MTRTSYRAEAFLEAARTLGVDAVVGSDHRPVLADRVPGRAIELSLSDVPAGVTAIERLARDHPLDAILAAEDEGAVLAAAAAAWLGLRHNPADAVAAARFKHLLRERLARAGVPGPRFRVAAIEDDPARLAETAPFPCVVKPVGLAASRGVIRADDPASFVEAFRRVRDLLRSPEVAERAGGGARIVLVEEYVPGREVAVEGLLTEGRLRALAIFDKPDPLEGPFFEETIYVTPSRLPEAIREAAVGAVARAVEALGLRTGPIHAEVRLTDGAPVVLEVAPRSIGGLCSRVLRFEPGGISLEELVLRHALGMDANGFERERSAAGVMMVPIPRAGVLREVRGLDAARATPGVEEVVISIPIGQEVVPLPEGSRYLGFIFAREARPQDVEAALRRAHGRLDLVIDPT